MTKLFALFLITILPILIVGQGTARAVAFRNVTVIDMRSEQPQPDMTVVIRGGRIVGIGRKTRVPQDAEVVDAAGKFMIPGLWDSYTFTLEAVRNDFRFFELLVANGVTGVRDVGTSLDLRSAAKLRDDINAGKIIAPRLFYAGTVLHGEVPPRKSTRWTGISMVVKTPEEAGAAVDSLARAGVDHIKTEKRTPPAILKEIVRTAHAHKLPVVSVPPSFIMDASNDGIDCVEHMAELFRETSDKREEYYALYRDHKIDTMTTNESYAFFGTMKTDEPYFKETLKTMARNRTCVVTNAAQTSTFIGDFEFADAARRRFKDKQQIASLDAAVAERDRQIRERDYRMADTNRTRHFREILELGHAGVMLLAGTQTAFDAIGTPGFILHDELAVLVRAGLSPFEALKTATVNPARFMRREKDLGTIERGKLADLILLDANPLADISNTRKINAVVLNGKYLSRKSLDKMLSEAAAPGKD